MGFADGPNSSVTIDFFDASGGLLGSVVQPLLGGYSAYSFSGVGILRGFTIYDNDAPPGSAYQNFEYKAVEAVPEPAMLLLPGAGLGAARDASLEERLAAAPAPRV